MISDGGIGTDCPIEDIYSLISENVSNTRTHFFGIGASAERDKIMRLAKCGKGAYEFAEENESFRHKVIGVLKKAIMPSLCNWKVTWDRPVQAYPSAEHLPSLYYNEAFQMFGLFTPGKIPRMATLECLNTKTNIRETFQVPINVKSATQGDDVHKLWARQAINEM